MIKKLLFLSILFLLSTKTYSQEHQISAGMGLGSTVQILDAFLEIGSGFSSVFFVSSYLDKTENKGEFRLAYAYTPKERWSYGAALSYNQSKFNVINREEIIGDQLNNFYTLAAETSYTFLKKDRVNLYALLGAGASFGKVKQTKYATAEVSRSQGTIFNFQITPIGVRYGKRWGGFAEVGFGYRGVLSFGIFYMP